MTYITELPSRGVIEVSGEDRVSFLQGLVSNDVAKVAPGRAIWAALLTPQGKYLADFFILTDADTLLLDCERSQIPMLAPKLSRFRLRAKVTVLAREELRVGVAWGSGAWGGAAPPGDVVAPDPRLPGAGWRLLSRTPLATNATPEDWDRHRLALALPDGTRDLEVDKTALLEAGFDELHGVSWTKGCYLGQELTARTKYRGLLKRRLVPVTANGELPAPGTPVHRDGVEVGTMRSGRDGIGLAVLRLDAIDAKLSAAGIELAARLPGWVKLTEAASH